MTIQLPKATEQLTSHTGNDVAILARMIHLEQDNRPAEKAKAFLNGHFERDDQDLTRDALERHRQAEPFRSVSSRAGDTGGKA